MAGDPTSLAGPLALGFPAPGSRVQKAYQNLWEAQNGSEERKKKLGNPANLPRPWDPATCLERGLRWELWLWLDEVAEWINSEYVWEASGGGCIPECWPLHPHLVHELAVVADQRRKAGQAPNSDVLENWHRYVLPGFVDRMRQRLKQSCDDDHQPWPARSRYTRHTSEAASAQRLRAFESDLLALTYDEDLKPARGQLTLLDGGGLIDPDTGEVF
ncbi:hypothetical protein ET989_01310 [Propioniciclava sinopodophylli]|uniref:Uncharacterized protein n=2 Tax=Propioniciclava sinopodophylli TaxID=1837344 RepID=A0A4Q9KH16_9ACTN|nr:hypothetical protein ET989_01310 [Propioniciclava sinopodophylli]